MIVWLIDYYFFIPDFAEANEAHVLESLKASGASQAEITRQSVKIANFSQMYKNSFFNTLRTYTEIVPVGLIVSVISAGILKRKKEDGFAPAV